MDFKICFISDINKDFKVNACFSLQINFEYATVTDTGFLFVYQTEERAGGT